jgi:Ca-activated chloride channel homolog
MYVTFTNSQYLWYMLSVPLLIASHFAFFKYSRKKAMRFANFQALKKVSEGKILSKNHTILWLRMFILICLIFALAGTKLYYKGITNQNDFVIALDTSSSMTAGDVAPSRIEAAKEYSKIFVEKVHPGTSVGLVTFSGAAFIEVLPTQELAKVRSILGEIEIANTGGTNIPDAIVTSTNLLLSSKKGRTIILITDGSNTASYFTRDPIKSGIKYAKENNVIINTIGLGNNEGPIGYLPEYYNISSVYEEANLIQIANETNGKYYYATTAAEVDAAFKGILSTSMEGYVEIDLGFGLLIISLGLLFMEWGLISTRFRALP